MALIHGLSSKRPCPTCLVDANELVNITKWSTLWTALDNQQLLWEVHGIQRISEREKLLLEHGIRDVDVSNPQLY
jgi:hypothetical protein